MDTVPQAATPGGPTIATSWLSATPPSGTVIPLGHNSINVGYNATQLSPGTYVGSLTIASNDPDETVLVIPVTLTVNAIVGVNDGLPARYGIKLASANPVRERATIELALPEHGQVFV